MLARSGLTAHRSAPLLLRSFSRDLRAALTQPPPVANHFTGSKHKIPQKRASFLMSQLQKTELEKLKDGREWPEFRAGDAIEVWIRPYMTAEPERIKGVVIAKTRKGVASSFVLINVEAGTPVQRRIPLYSPLIQNIKVIQEAFIHKGKRRVRRSKLYYLWERDPDSFTVR